MVPVTDDLYSKLRETLGKPANLHQPQGPQPQDLDFEESKEGPSLRSRLYQIVDGFIQETSSNQKEARDETDKVRGELADIKKLVARHSDLVGDVDRIRQNLERKLETLKMAAVDE